MLQSLDVGELERMEAQRAEHEANVAFLAEQEFRSGGNTAGAKGGNTAGAKGGNAAGDGGKKAGAAVNAKREIERVINEAVHNKAAHEMDAMDQNHDGKIDR